MRARVEPSARLGHGTPQSVQPRAGAEAVAGRRPAGVPHLDEEDVAVGVHSCPHGGADGVPGGVGQPLSEYAIGERHTFPGDDPDAAAVIGPRERGGEGVQLVQGACGVERRAESVEFRQGGASGLRGVPERRRPQLRDVQPERGTRRHHNPGETVPGHVVQLGGEARPLGPCRVARDGRRVPQELPAAQPGGRAATACTARRPDPGAHAQREDAARRRHTRRRAAPGDQ
nr:hypothetical protein [Microbispora siamensis]